MAVGTPDPIPERARDRRRRRADIIACGLVSLVSQQVAGLLILWPLRICGPICAGGLGRCQGHFQVSWEWASRQARALAPPG
jgi:hypothetical protein